MIDGVRMNQSLFTSYTTVRLSAAFILIGLLISAGVQANPNGRLLATGGAMTAEGTAGGGIVPWAMIAGYADESEWGGTAWLTGVEPKDFSLNAFGAALAWNNRVELSVSKQSFDINAVAPGETLEQSIVGIKTRVYGNLIYSRAPQISMGLLYKQNDTFTIPGAVGALDDSGFDVYVAASKLWLDGLFNRSVFLNGTVRATRANQLGLLGFGGDLNDSHEVVGEVSAGLFINRSWVLGAEYRQKPDNLSFAREDDWQDVFIGWFPNKRVSVVLAWAGLGSIAGFEDQDSVYLSLQLSQ